MINIIGVSQLPDGRICFKTTDDRDIIIGFAGKYRFCSKRDDATIKVTDIVSSEKYLFHFPFDSETYYKTYSDARTLLDDVITKQTLRGASWHTIGSGEDMHFVFEPKHDIGNWVKLIPYKSICGIHCYDDNKLLHIICGSRSLFLRDVQQYESLVSHLQQERL